MSSKKPPDEKPTLPVIALASLGCCKNTADSEHILGLLRDSGFPLTADETLAEIIIINTCAFLSEAREESFETIRRLNRNRRKGRLKQLWVTGCMAVRDAGLIRKRTPCVDRIVSPFALKEMVALAWNPAGQGLQIIDHPFDRPPMAGTRVRITPASYAYVKIADGCDNHCSYCRIPSLRGPYRSKPPDWIRQECSVLLETGVREIALISQDSTRYGSDLGLSTRSKSGLSILLARLARLPGLVWLRLLYLYPERITDDLLDCIRDCGPVCRYLDIPLQHVDGSILKRMNRSQNPAVIRRLVDRIRAAVPGIAIRSTFITGFPGETPEAFESLRKFIEEGYIDHAGVFVFSREPGTKAADFDQQVPVILAEERRDILMSLQQVVSARNQRSYVNTVLPVLVDEVDLKQGKSRGRTEFQAPEADGHVSIEAQLAPGTFLPIRIVSSRPYDLTGTPIPIGLEG